jgi:hypothetical protein
VTLPLICNAQAVSCGECWQWPGLPCGDGWDHLARYMRASRRGLIRTDELQRVVHLAVTLSGVPVVRHEDGRTLYND